LPARKGAPAHDHGLASADRAAQIAAMPAPSTPPRAIATPCVQVCVIDNDSGLCLGCFRTLAEIGGWTRLSDAERAALIVALPARRGLIRPEKLGPA
jgi:predicted Fe-S protein YdhL (DUF1289 family)